MEALVNKSTGPFNPDYYLWAYIIFQGVTLLYFTLILRAVCAGSTLLLVEPKCRMLWQKIIKLNWLCINLLLLPGKRNFT